MGEPAAKKPRLDEATEVKYTKIFINNEWVDSGESIDVYLVPTPYIDSPSTSFG